MPTPNQSSRSKPSKVPACDPCRSLKLRCDHEKPTCSRCRERGRVADCEYRPRPFKRPIGRILEKSVNRKCVEQNTNICAIAVASRPRVPEANTEPSDTECVEHLRTPSIQYPNPGYLGSSSHTTLFDQLRLGRDFGPNDFSPADAGRINPPTEYTVDETCISRGAEFILELHHDSIIRPLVQLVEIWSTKGANLALAGPFTMPCAATVTRLLFHRGKDLASALELSRSLFYHSCRPISFNHRTPFDDYCGEFCGQNARWESLGIFFTAACRAAVDLSYAETLYGSEQQRRKIQKLALSYSDRCLDLCLPLDCMNDVQLILQYENFISHSQVDGDQSYLSWRKLGDVAASLFALGYHQQKAGSFEGVPDFTSTLRLTAFCRTYSADKNVSIFLGRPPRIIRKFCHFYLPSSDLQPPQEASRKPPAWSQARGPNFTTDSRWAALCAILKEDILDLYTKDNYDERNHQARLIDADACAQWNAVPADHRLDCDLKSCNRQPVERDFMANMKLNYLHVHFLLRLACVCPMATGGDPDLVRVSTEMLSLVVETIMLKDQILNSGTSLVWKVTQISPVL
ncbi:unnamed protein product [Penicillium olsonii]|nr:unnamed protein product [Penicillium olsonii]